MERKRYKIYDVTENRNQSLVDPDKKSFVYYSSRNNPQAVLDVIPSVESASVWFTNLTKDKKRKIDERRFIELDQFGHPGYVEFSNINEGIMIDGLPFSRRRLRQIAILLEAYREDMIKKVPKIFYNGKQIQ